MRLLVASILIVGLAGCSSGMKLKGPPVNVSGKVLRGSRPVTGIVMIFHPLGDGHVRQFPLHRDGTFNGELICGEYAYYIAKPNVAGAVQAPIKLSAKYFEADLARTVTVEPDKLLAIALE